MAIDTRPTTLTNTHQYNLRNQGWPEEFVCAPNRSGNNAAPITTDPIEYTKSILGVYPSNADVIYLSRLQGAGEARNLNTYSPWDLDKIIQGNTPAARGHFIINAFDRNRQDVSGISGIYDEDRDVDTSRPISVAFAFGRVWYLMRDGHLYYSQTILQIDQASKCFQEADPTAEDVNELVATDGGEMDVTGIGRAYSLVSAGDELLIMADNGIWSVSGGTDTGFTATNQIIRKITTQGVLGPESSCEVEGAVFYWGEGGIYLLTPNEATGLLEPLNVSETTIQTFYIAIPETGKKHCRSKYDPRTKKIFWMYNDTEDYDGVNFRYAYNKFLVFDTTIQAFYTYSIAYDLDNLPFVAGLIEKESIAFELEQENVTNSGTTVTNGGITVTATVSTAVSSEVRLKVFTLVKNPDTVISFASGSGDDNNTINVDGYAPSVAIDSSLNLEVTAANVGSITINSQSFGTPNTGWYQAGGSVSPASPSLGGALMHGIFVFYNASTQTYDWRVVLQTILPQDHFSQFTFEYNLDGVGPPTDDYTVLTSAADNFYQLPGATDYTVWEWKLSWDDGPPDYNPWYRTWATGQTFNVEFI